MSDGQKEQGIDVYQSRRFEKALDKLPESQQKVIEDEIDKIIDNPTIGEQKKGDLNFLWVHKFQVNNQLALLGYSWVEDKLELYLLSIGSHENFYQDQKKRRKADLKLIR
ncbi:ParE-like toxin of type II ParDE toxin-antitoxin system [Klebsiella oxytoca]|uniref:ParE-like toxin of type II ParDE toxin-antitoxin system n=1 Tax=Klebsiella oxytoca TaxID=571 RepID=A0A318FWI5_KLEOX|nr:type II toxin-antitoxin system RelE/ParE family toxin [Klebsiella oxytoca]PXW46382.1 ParE-like toxin of type II ParDE toxin-antitoxin system [Klebsiella oxytoca]HCB1502502.1 type II toxin-antitoxin system RelE/ParE family toxin [Klebsiella michiganensis]HCB1848968.1 type II toxin-antitoxin system RelE/ParE family toxin [Klebsiella oxytoca]